MATERYNTWLADVVLALREMEDQQAWLSDLYDWIRRNRKSRPRNFASVIRATIYAHSTDAAAYVPGNPDVFRKVARGFWALRLPNEKEVPQKSTDLRNHVISRLTAEELMSFAGRGNALFDEINKRVEEIRCKFKMTQTDSGQ